MPTLQTKLRCQKCGGNLFLESDDHDIYLKCLQCSAEHDLDGSLRLPRDPRKEGINLQASDRRYGSRGGFHQRIG